MFTLSTFLKKSCFVLLLGAIAVLTLLSFDHMASWFSSDTLEPVKTYKVTFPKEKKESSQLVKELDRPDTEVRKPFEEKQGPNLGETSPVLDLNPVDLLQNGGAESVITDEATHLSQESGRTPPFSAENARKRAISKRLREIDDEIAAIMPFVNEDRDLLLRFTLLREEMVKLHKERGTYHAHGAVDPMIGNKLTKLVLSVTTDGKIPVSLGEQIADILEEGGSYEHAARVRAVTQRAIENGDEFYKPEHLDESYKSEHGGDY